MSVDFDVVDALAGLTEDLRSEGDFVARIHDAVAALKKERDEARDEIARLKKRFDDQWYECHDGSEQACCKSHE